LKRVLEGATEFRKRDGAYGLDLRRPHDDRRISGAKPQAAN
jgi:hypothetical protein